jgi:hypothetical protein
MTLILEGLEDLRLTVLGLWNPWHRDNGSLFLVRHTKSPGLQDLRIEGLSEFDFLFR